MSPATSPLATQLHWALHDGRTAEVAGRWDDAIAAYRHAQRLSDQRYMAQADYLFAERVLGEAAQLSSVLGYALCRANRLEEAVVALEASRARSLFPVMSDSSDVDLDRLRTAGRSDLADRIADVLGTLRRFDVERLRPSLAGPDGLVDDMRELREHRERLLGEARQVLGFSDLLPALRVEQLRRETEGVPTIYLCAGETGGIALVIPADPRARLVQINLPGASAAAVRTQARDLMKADSLRVNYGLRSFGRIDDCCRWLWETVFHPMAAEGVEQIGTPVIVPCGWFAILPIHAAWKPDVSSPDGRRYLLDDLSHSIVPSIGVLSMIRGRKETNHGVRTLIVADPQPTSHSELPGARWEAERISGMMPGAVRLVGHEATLRSALDLMSDRTIIHIAAHGRYIPGSSVRAGLLFAQDEWWEVHDMARVSLTAAPLVVLSGCNTAAIGNTAPDEVMGMPAALLKAGARSVIASLWSVADDSTGLLMEQFYSMLLKLSGNIPAALRQAQLWLRNATVGELEIRAPQPRTTYVGLQADARPYNHPYYWAAFYCVGVPGN